MIHCIRFIIINLEAKFFTRFDLSGPSFFALPEYLHKSQYKNPQNPHDGAFQLGHDTKDHLFEWISQRPERLSQFQNHMAGYRTGRRSWMDPGFYPLEKNLIEGTEIQDNAVFLVDIGGGKGHDLQELCRKYPDLPGKVVLQDLTGVIKEAEAEAVGLDTKIVLMDHDFFTRQPIKGMITNLIDESANIARCTSLLYAFLSP